MIVIAGNCILEDMDTSIATAEFLVEMSSRYEFDLIYKSSWRKDNRSSVEGYQGLSVEESMEIFSCIPAEVMTDFHTPEQLEFPITEVVDWLQVPAYLCMQTELVLAMASLGKPINIKKGQFLSPYDVGHVVEKIESVSNAGIMITERGTCFGYRDLVVDPRSFHILKKLGHPVIFDAGHAVRKYGIPSSDVGGGSKEFIPTLAKAAVATGIAGIFVEVHPEPSRAKCDAATQLTFNEFESLIKQVLPIWEAS